jgi:hypothetical protein
MSFSVPVLANGRTLTPLLVDIVAADSRVHTADATPFLNIGESVASCTVAVVNHTSGVDVTATTTSGACTTGGNVASQLFAGPGFAYGQVYRVVWKFVLSNNQILGLEQFFRVVG